jgi:hypothetical protein
VGFAHGKQDHLISISDPVDTCKIFSQGSVFTPRSECQQGYQAGYSFLINIVQQQLAIAANKRTLAYTTGFNVGAHNSTKLSCGQFQGRTGFICSAAFDDGTQINYCDRKLKWLGWSAGQAAVYLARKTKRVHVLVRSAGLAESMSRYLVRRIEETPTIVIRPHTKIVAPEGGDHLESVRGETAKQGKLSSTGSATSSAKFHYLFRLNLYYNSLMISFSVVMFSDS